MIVVPCLCVKVMCVCVCFRVMVVWNVGIQGFLRILICFVYCNLRKSS